jgi:hypothetical protein
MVLKLVVFILLRILGQVRSGNPEPESMVC